MLVTLQGRIVGPRGIDPGAVTIEDGRIASVRHGPAPGAPLLLPGFVDLHVHGGGGHDAMDGEGGVRGLAAFHARHGTTSLCPTTVTESESRLREVVAAVGAVQKSELANRARVLGTHLEGPFISEKRLGAQPRKAIAADRATLERLLDAGPVAIVTLAPELAGARELIELCAARSVRASLGHTHATYDQAKEAFARGARGATHLFNAMTGIHHREPGVAIAALEAESAVLELILDGHHVHPSLFRIAVRAAKGKVALVTDAIRAAGMAEGETELGGQKVVVKSGRATLQDGTLAGSVLTLDRALRNAIDAGLSIEEASRVLSTNPADALGRADIGRIVPGARADLVELDASTLEVKRVFVDGREVER